MFNEDSGLVQLWVNMVRDKKYDCDLVPDLSNLREVVFGILDKAND